MATQLIESSKNLISIKVHGLLKKSDADQVQQLAAQKIRSEGSIKALILLEGFTGWERGQDWGDVSFLLEYDGRIDKIAVVGDPKWKDEVYAFLGKPFRKGQVEYFQPADLHKAKLWLGEEPA